MTKKDHPFHDVCVYDSIRKSARKTDASIYKSTAGQLLRELQQFLLLYCTGTSADTNDRLADPDFILRTCKYMKCPQQQNGYDCGLFAFATVLHLVLLDHPNVEDAFSQKNISNLRHSLYDVLSANKDVDFKYMCSFFPRLQLLQEPQEPEAPHDVDGLSSSSDDDSLFALSSDAMDDDESRHDCDDDPVPDKKLPAISLQPPPSHVIDNKVMDLEEVESVEVVELVHDDGDHFFPQEDCDDDTINDNPNPTAEEQIVVHSVDDNMEEADSLFIDFFLQRRSEHLSN